MPSTEQAHAQAWVQVATVRAGRIGPQGVRVVTAKLLEMKAHSGKNARVKHTREEMNHKSKVLTTFVVLCSPDVFFC